MQSPLRERLRTHCAPGVDDDQYQRSEGGEKGECFARLLPTSKTTQGYDVFTPPYHRTLQRLSRFYSEAACFRIWCSQGSYRGDQPRPLCDRRCRCSKTCRREYPDPARTFATPAEAPLDQHPLTHLCP